MSQQLSVIEKFASHVQSEKFRTQLTQALPPSISVDRFTRVLLTAWQINPDVLQCESKSVFTAVLSAAQQGLMPDGREGVILKYSVKAKDPTTGQWAKTDKAQFQPMVAGVIKRFAEAEVSAYAGTVYANDHFEAWNDDAGQHVIHKPKHFGDRGEWLGCYAVATINGRTYVEVAGVDEIHKIRSKSKGAFDYDGNLKGPWLDWPERMGQKSMLHRLGRRVPMSANTDAAERLARTINADREDFEPTDTIPTATEPPQQPRSRPRVFDGVATTVADENAPESPAEPVSVDPVTQEDEF